MRIRDLKEIIKDLSDDPEVRFGRELSDNFFIRGLDISEVKYGKNIEYTTYRAKPRLIPKREIQDYHPIIEKIKDYKILFISDKKPLHERAKDPDKRIIEINNKISEVNNILAKYSLDLNLKCAITQYSPGRQCTSTLTCYLEDKTVNNYYYGPKGNEIFSIYLPNPDSIRTSSYYYEKCGYQNTNFRFLYFKIEDIESCIMYYILTHLKPFGILKTKLIFGEYMGDLKKANLSDILVKLSTKIYTTSSYYSKNTKIKNSDLYSNNGEWDKFKELVKEEVEGIL